MRQTERNTYRIREIERERKSERKRERQIESN